MGPRRVNAVLLCVAKIRKKPKPADALSGQQQEDQPPVQPPPPVEYRPPVAQDIYIAVPRSPEEIVHNLMLRQVQDDLVDPPQAESSHPALELLKKVQEARDRGESLEAYKEETTRILYGIDQEERLASAVLRVYALRKLRRQLETDEFLDKFLHRLAKRGDLTPREAMVLKQLTMNEMAKTAKELVDRLNAPTLENFNGADLSRMDYTLQVTEKTTNKVFAGTTPQGREIIRKITLRAQRRIFEAQQPAKK